MNHLFDRINLLTDKYAINDFTLHYFVIPMSGIREWCVILDFTVIPDIENPYIIYYSENLEKAFKGCWDKYNNLMKVSKDK